MLGHVGANVRRQRLKVGLTQEQLAEAADLDLTFVQRIERGKTNVGVVVLVKLADVLGVKPGALFRATKVPEVKRGRPRKARSP